MKALFLGCSLAVCPSLCGQQLPVALRCGWDPETPRRGTDSWGQVLPDIAFKAQRSYGHVGGRPGRVESFRVAGGDPGWPVTWREGDVKYVVRLPKGEYQVDLAFVETAVAASGLRVFDVEAEERPVIPRLDIFDEAGDFAWLVRSLVVRVDDGWLDLRLVPATADWKPRISRIGVRRYEAPARRSTALPTPRLRGRAGFGQSTLWWDPTAPVGVAGYGVFRSATPEGPYASLHARPLHSPSFIDRQLAGGPSYHYKLRAYGLDGSQSPFSPALTLIPERLEEIRRKRYDVRLDPGAWKRISVRADPPAQVAGELGFYGRRYPVEFGLDTGDGAWQARKTLYIDMSRDPYRVFHKRRRLVLQAEAGDFTQMREMLSSESARILGLASPFVEPVLVLLNGRFWGQRLDVERLGDRFRRRARLDRDGVMVRLGAGDRWWSDWEPRGRRVGKSGDVVALNYLIRQLNRLDEGEVPGFFEDQFYLDRFITRLALGAVRGELEAPARSYYLLRDSRNGRWEFFRQSHRHRDWGIVDFTTDLFEPSSEELERTLFPRTLRVGSEARAGWMVLLTRFFKVPRFRELYLRRVEKIMNDLLSPEAFDAVVTTVFGEIEAGVVREPFLWPFDHGASFGGAPDKLGASHRKRLAGLQEIIARERKRPSEPVVIDSFLLNPRQGEPWVALGNRSAKSVDLSGYRISESLDQAGRALRDAPTLAPGQVVRLPLSGDAEKRARRAGGILSLWRRGGRRPVLADFVFHGHQTGGIAYGRTPRGGEAWTHFRAPEDSDAEAREPLSSPSYQFVQGVDEERSGDLTIWFKPLGRSRSPESLSHVVLRYQERGAGPRGAGGDDDYREVELVWDKERFRYSLTLENDERRRRTAYYFLASTADGVERAYPLGAPAVTYFLTVRPEIYINEVCPRPGEGPDAPGEFIELYNASDRAVSLRGMYLTDTNRVPTKWRVTDDVVIKAGGYVVFYADGLDRGLHTSFKLKNSGEFVGLYGPVSEGNLRIDRIAYRGMPPGHSWGRKQDGTRGFRAWEHPTPGRQNIPKIPERFLKGGKSRRHEEEEGGNEGEDSAPPGRSRG